MKTIVITGSTSGIGLGLADAFLAQGCNVTISGRSQEKLEKAFDILASKSYYNRHLFGAYVKFYNSNQINHGYIFWFYRLMDPAGVSFQMFCCVKGNCLGFRPNLQNHVILTAFFELLNMTGLPQVLILTIL